MASSTANHSMLQKLIAKQNDSNSKSANIMWRIFNYNILYLLHCYCLGSSGFSRYGSCMVAGKTVWILVKQMSYPSALKAKLVQLSAIQIHVYFTIKIYYLLITYYSTYPWRTFGDPPSLTVESIQTSVVHAVVVVVIVAIAVTNHRLYIINTKQTLLAWLQ